MIPITTIYCSYEVDISILILKYCAENDIQIPGYYLKEVFENHYRQQEGEFLDDEDEIDLYQIFLDINKAITFENLQVQLLPHLIR